MLLKVVEISLILHSFQTYTYKAQLGPKGYGKRTSLPCVILKINFKSKPAWT